MTGRLRASTDFSSVDRSSDPAAHIGYLDAASALESTAAYKQRMLQLLAPQPGLRVLNVGCGTGEDVRGLAELVMPGGWAVGVDSSETMVAEARRRATDAGTSADF